MRPVLLSIIMLLNLLGYCLFDFFSLHGGSRIAPSSRMTSPLSIEFVKIDMTRWPNSSGSPKREGHGTDAPSSSLTV